MKHILFALVLLFGVTSVVAAGDFEDGKDALAHKDFATAFQKFLNAAEAGHTRAQYNLAWMYANGDGVPQDYQQAVRWYRKVAEARHTKAQYDLGVMYANGDGVPQDDQQAVQWYRKAAEAGHTKAQYNLASMYYFGKGVPLDYVLAYMWANLAASHGGEDEGSKRDAIATFMTPHQIAEAQELAREWKPIK